MNILENIFYDKDDDEKNYTFINKEEIIRAVAKEKNYTIKDVRDVYETIEDTVVNFLSKATPGYPVEVKIFSGVSLFGKFLLAGSYVNPQNQEPVMENKIGVVSKVYKAFRLKVNKELQRKMDELL